MSFREMQLEKALAQPGCAVFYFYSTQEFLVRDAAQKTVRRLMQAGDAELTRIEGPAPDIGEAVAAAGTISLFGTKRVVELPRVEPAAMGEKDVEALCDLLQSLENAVMVLTTVFKDDKAKSTKKAKLLISTAAKAGVALEFEKPSPGAVRDFLAARAQALGTRLAPGAADAMVQRCGTDLYTLENELAKLAAVCGYTEVTPALVQQMGTLNVEADVFEMVRFVTANQLPRALHKLSQLLALQNEPIAITAALSGTFIDMYRMKLGAAQRRPAATVMKDFGYRGSDWRLRKAGESAAKYTRTQLEHILTILTRLDAALKSSAADGAALLETALCEIALAAQHA